MRIHPQQPASQEATTLMTTLVILGLIASISATYLTLVTSRTRLVFREQAWERCIATCEAGVEEALGHLNKNGLTNMTSQGWTATNGSATRTRTLGEGYYSVTISTNTNSVVTIQAIGYQPLPHLTDQFISRQVKVTAKPKPKFPYAIVTADKNEVGGNVDSFDSSNPAYSTGGAYDPAKARDQAFVGSNRKVKSKILKVKSKAKVYGRIAVGAGSTYDVHSKGSVGDSAWVNGGFTGVQTGHATDDMNLLFPPVPVPFSGGYFSPGPGTKDGTNYLYLMPTGDYLLSELKLGANQLVAVTGAARLLVNGKIEIDKGSITIFNGASFELYATDDVTLAGTAINNLTGNAASFGLYGLPSNTKIEIKKKSKVNTTVVGTIYAPSAEVTLEDTATLVGSTVSYKFTMGKEGYVHYDEALAGVSGLEFVILSWEEL